jgi:predicted dehydrogenase
MDKVRIAVIGTGYIADYHVRGLLAQPGVEITAVAAATQDSVERFAKKYNIKGVLTPEALTLVDRDDIDAVIISTPNNYHAPYALAFLEGGKDVFLEKPMAMDAAGGQEIIHRAGETGRIVMVGHMWRFDEEVNALRSEVLAGRLGDIVKTKGYGIHVNWGPEGWFTKKDLAGGGALIDMGVHAIDTVRYLLGDPAPVRVYAEISTRYGTYDVDDTAVVVITWDNGTVSVVESGWWHPHADGPEAATRLFGTKGYGSVFPTFLKEMEGEEEDITPAGLSKTEHCDQSIYDRQMEHFITCVRERKQPSPGGEEGLTVMRIVDAAYRSAETNTAVFLKME